MFVYGQNSVVYYMVKVSANPKLTEKISICSNRGREESVGNDDASIVCARKYEMVRMT